jgi:hypothetical protein
MEQIKTFVFDENFSATIETIWKGQEPANLSDRMCMAVKIKIPDNQDFKFGKRLRIFNGADLYVSTVITITVTGETWPEAMRNLQTYVFDDLEILKEAYLKRIDARKNADIER